MATNTFPALGIQPPQQEDLMAQYARLVGIRNMQQQSQFQAQMQPLQLQQQQEAAAQAHIATQRDRQAQQDEQIIGSLWKANQGDVYKTIAALPDSGVSPQGQMKLQQSLSALREQISKGNKEQFDSMRAANAQIVPMAQSVLAAPPEDQPLYYELARRQIARTPELAQYAKDLPGQYPGPELLTNFLNSHKTIEQLASDRTFGAEHGGLRGDQIAQLNKGFSDRLQAAQQPVSPELQLPANASVDDFTRINRQIEAMEQAAQRKVQNKLAQQRINIQVNPGAPLTDVALDQASEKYFMTGQLPPGNRGTAGLLQNRAIMNRAAVLHPEGNLAANSAEFAANAASLKNLQKSFDQVSAFENTAGKNLDVFLNQAKNVIDSGIPLLNTPVRMVTGKLGGTNQAAFDAARTTALTEISKVLNSANASAVVSDSARREVEGLIGKDATLPQIYSAATVLRQDMANRHQSYSEQITDIQRRMKGGGGAVAPTHRYNPATGKIEAVGGQQ